MTAETHDYQHMGTLVKDYAREISPPHWAAVVGYITGLRLQREQFYVRELVERYRYGEPLTLVGDDSYRVGRSRRLQLQCDLLAVVEGNP